MRPRRSGCCARYAISYLFEMARTIGLGVALSLIGSVTVAPQAIAELRTVARDDAIKTRGFLAKFLPFLRRSAQYRLQP
jgi:hypothetical protein